MFDRKGGMMRRQLKVSFSIKKESVFGFGVFVGWEGLMILVGPVGLKLKLGE